MSKTSVPKIHTWVLVVADSEVRWNERAQGVASGAIRVDGVDGWADIHSRGVASDVSGVLPHELREVAPGLEVAHVRVGLAVKSSVGELPLLAIVEHVGDNRHDAGRIDTGSDVLTVAATSHLTANRQSVLCLSKPRQKSTYVL